MTKRIIASILLFVSIMANADAWAASSPLADYYSGVWVGTASISAFDGTKQMDGFPKTMQIKLDVSEKESTMYMRTSESEPWQPILLSIYTFSGSSSMVSGTYIRSGKDAEGIWNEHQDIVLSRLDQDSAYLYLSRAVNNTQMKPYAPQSKFATFSIGKLVRAK